jgi:hypothetical protein
MTSFERDFRRFKKLYNLAVKYNQSQFIFDENPVLTTYAKYYIEYAENKVLPTLKKKT